MLSRICSVLPPGKSVRPMDSRKSVSPLNNSPASAAYRHRLPIVWPGVWITLSVSPATSRSSPSTG